MSRFIAIVVGFFLLPSLLITGCSAEERAGVLTAIAPSAQTAVEQGKNYASTQAAELKDTAQARLATEAAEVKETAKARAATEFAEYIDTAQAKLVTEAVKQITQAPTSWIIFKGTAGSVLGTQAAIQLPQAETQAVILAKTAQARLATEVAVHGPQALTEVASINQTAAAVATQATLDLSALQTRAAAPQQTLVSPLVTPPAPSLPVPGPATATPGIQPTIITYTTLQGDTISSIARQFSIPADSLLQLNLARYPSLQSDPDSLEAGSTLLLAANPPDIYTHSVSPAQPPWSSNPECDLSRVDWLVAPVTCEPFSIEVVSQVSLNFDCVSMDNLLGYQQTHMLNTGWLLTDARGVLSYGWFIDRRQDVVLIGPAIVSNSSTRITCGK